MFFLGEILILVSCPTVGGGGAGQVPVILQLCNRAQSSWQVTAVFVVSPVYTRAVVVSEPAKLKNKQNLPRIPRIQLSLIHSVSLSSCLKWPGGGAEAGDSRAHSVRDLASIPIDLSLPVLN